ncbi:hypothetical protein FB451DRAFT_945372, partial [Mycena latifolia]
VEKRLSIEDCIKIAEALNTCYTLGSNIRAIGSAISSWVKSRSDANDCTVHTGAIDGVQWRYSATGNNCDSTAQIMTIRGAIDAFLAENVDGRCSNVCLRMTHGGTWTGYLSLTPVG